MENIQNTGEINTSLNQDQTKFLSMKKSEIPNPINQKKPLLKYNITGIEFTIIFTLTISLHFYYLAETSQQMHKIQSETQMSGVVPSWFGYWRDDSDAQWREFRNNLVLFIPGMLTFVILGRVIRNYQTQKPEQQFQALIIYFVITGCCFLGFLFAGGFIMWTFFTFTNYFMQKILYKYKFYPIILWTYSIWSLYYIYFYHDEPFKILNYIIPNLGTNLQNSSQGAIVAWYAVQNMTMLRVMSFCLDKHWSYRKLYQFDLNKHQKRCTECGENKTCLKARIDRSLESKQYDSILNYYAYLMYLPLFITGPQVTYNAFISQVQISQNIYSTKTTLIYFFRAMGTLLELEIYTHLQFAAALGKYEENKQYWIQFSIMHCLFMGLLNIFFVWLKFLALWRVARSFSLLFGFIYFKVLGIDCPENMVGCIFSSTGFEEFWRSWHRGFNQWLIRYLFIPLGGSSTKVWNIWVVFTFVAIWHDFQLDLVVWAWFICAALIPEILVKKWASKQTYLWNSWWFKVITLFNYEYVCLTCGSFYVWLMLFANLIGFGSGWYNVQIIFSKFNESGAYNQLITAFISTISYRVILFYVRDKQPLKED